MPYLFDAQNSKAVEIYEYLSALLDARRLPSHLHVVIGGDGFMLKSVREHHRQEHVFLGLNCGHLGFLLNEIPEDLDRLPSLILSERLRVQSFPRISMKAVDLKGNVHSASALNDIYLERMTGQTCNLKIQINGTDVVNKIVCDGLILSTAVGSTAYNFSAGGAVCHPSLEVVAITPICPHAPRLTPLLFPLRSTIVAEVLNHDKRRVRAVADGVDYNDIAFITITDARSPVRIGFFPEHDFTGTLVSKLLHS